MIEEKNKKKNFYGFPINRRKYSCIKIKIEKYTDNSLSSHWILMEIEVTYYELVKQQTFLLDCKGALKPTFLVIQIFNWMLSNRQFAKDPTGRLQPISPGFLPAERQKQA